MGGSGQALQGVGAGAGDVAEVLRAVEVSQLDHPVLGNQNVPALLDQTRAGGQRKWSSSFGKLTPYSKQMFARPWQGKT